MQRRVLPQFGEAVTRVLKEHGLSDRGGQYRTEIDRITLADMRNGYVPRLEQVERFAAGFGLDVNEWRVLAGYEPIRETDPDRLIDGMAAAEPDRLTGALVRGLQEYPQMRETLRRAFGDEDADS